MGTNIFFVLRGNFAHFKKIKNLTENLRKNKLALILNKLDILKKKGGNFYICCLLKHAEPLNV
jgi:hypothetical protein